MIGSRNLPSIKNSCYNLLYVLHHCAQTTFFSSEQEPPPHFKTLAKLFPVHFLFLIFKGAQYSSCWLIPSTCKHSEMGYSYKLMKSKFCPLAWAISFCCHHYIYRDDKSNYIFFDIKLMIFTILMKELECVKVKLQMRNYIASSESEIDEDKTNNDHIKTKIDRYHALL